MKKILTVITVLFLTIILSACASDTGLITDNQFESYREDNNLDDSTIMTEEEYILLKKQFLQMYNDAFLDQLKHGELLEPSMNERVVLYFMGLLYYTEGIEYNQDQIDDLTLFEEYNDIVAPMTHFELKTLLETGKQSTLSHGDLHVLYKTGENTYLYKNNSDEFPYEQEIIYDELTKTFSFGLERQVELATRINDNLFDGIKTDVDVQIIFENGYVYMASKQLDNFGDIYVSYVVVTPSYNMAFVINDYGTSKSIYFSYQTEETSQIISLMQDQYMTITGDETYSDILSHLLEDNGAYDNVILSEELRSKFDQAVLKLVEQITIDE